MTQESVLSESATRKIGPLPAYAWVAIPAGLYIAYSWWRHRKTPTAVAASDVESTVDTGTPAGYEDAFNTLSNQVGQFQATQDAVNTLTDQVAELQASQTPPPSPSVEASPPAPVRVTPPTLVKMSVVKTAPNPAPKPGPHIAPRPAPKPTPKPVTHIYVVKSGDTLSAIGRRYGVSWQTIYNTNKKLIGNNPNLIHPGQRLTIPAH